ncbi:MAG TPA: helix-hairpin-helix domain-containing protein [Rhizomicrobium sp.]|jgi:DNA uptake protein ComE-like DNA-binding protein
MKSPLSRVLFLSLALAGTPVLAPTMAQAAPANTAMKHGLVDINSASQTDLEQLPGIGPVMAKKIIDGRPYRSKDELVRRKIVPVSAYGPIKHHVIAHHTA